jgi:hypothetical protein
VNVEEFSFTEMEADWNLRAFSWTLLVTLHLALALRRAGIPGCPKVG